MWWVRPQLFAAVSRWLNWHDWFPWNPFSMSLSSLLWWHRSDLLPTQTGSGIWANRRPRLHLQHLMPPTSLSADWFYWWPCAGAFQILTQFNSLSLQKTKAEIKCATHFRLSLIGLEKVPVSARARARRGAAKWYQAGKGDGTRVGRQGRSVRTRRTSSFLPWQAVQHEFRVYPYRKSWSFSPKVAPLADCLQVWMSSSVSAEAETKRRQNWLRLSYLCLWWSHTFHIARPWLEKWSVLNPLPPNPLLFYLLLWGFFVVVVVFFKNLKKENLGCENGKECQ